MPDPFVSAGPGADVVTRVLIVDDHPILRHGIAQLVQREPDLDPCAEAGTIDEALAALARQPIDLATQQLLILAEPLTTESFAIGPATATYRVGLRAQQLDMPGTVEFNLPPRAEP